MNHIPENVWNAKTPATTINRLRLWWHGLCTMHNLIYVETDNGPNLLGCYGCDWQ